MKSLLLDATAVTPEVAFHPAEGTLAIRGECYPESPISFFGQVMAAVGLHLGTRPARLAVALQLAYVNSASTKAFRKLLVRLDEAAQRGTAVTVAWEHEASDDTMAELGRDLLEDLHFLAVVVRPFEYREAG
jgi:hypothetical protein